MVLLKAQINYPYEFPFGYLMFV